MGKQALSQEECFSNSAPIPTSLDLLPFQSPFKPNTVPMQTQFRAGLIGLCNGIDKAYDKLRPIAGIKE